MHHCLRSVTAVVAVVQCSAMLRLVMCECFFYVAAAGVAVVSARVDTAG
jgi:hypothetical protein